MNNILSEKEYQHFVMDRLSQDNGYIIRGIMLKDSASRMQAL